MRPISPRQRASGNEVSCCARAARAGVAASMRVARSRKNAALALPDNAASTGVACAASFIAVATSAAVAEWKTSGMSFQRALSKAFHVRPPTRPREKPKYERPVRADILADLWAVLEGLLQGRRCQGEVSASQGQTRATHGRVTTADFCLDPLDVLDELRNGIQTQ